MNLILCEAQEVAPDGLVTLTGTRAAHVRGVLRAQAGDVVRIGIVDGPKGRGEVLALDDGGAVTLRCELEATAPPVPAIDLLLALPRPKVLRRLWAQLAALGVGRIVLTNAERVERQYFDTHVLDQATYRPLLIEGLQQAADTRLPRVSIHRQLRILVEDELGPAPAGERRLVAHPGSRPSPLALAPDAHRPRTLLAIGPEGGWNAFELGLLERAGFEGISLGPTDPPHRHGVHRAVVAAARAAALGVTPGREKIDAIVTTLRAALAWLAMTVPGVGRPLGLPDRPRRSQGHYGPCHGRRRRRRQRRHPAGARRRRPTGARAASCSCRRAATASRGRI